MKVNIEKDELIINFKDLIYEFYYKMSKEQILDLIEHFGWLPKLFKVTSKMLTDEFSRKNYNEFIHEERAEFLQMVKEKEIEYHADRLASLIEERIRKSRDYWKLYHYVKETFGHHLDATWKPPKNEEINFDLKRELEDMIARALKIKLKLIKEE